MRGRGDASFEQHQALMSELEAKKQRLEAQMSRGLRRADERRRVSIEAVQEKIPEGAALVEIASYEPIPWAPEAPRDEGERVGGLAVDQAPPAGE